MGVKRRRVALSDLIIKNGKYYVKQKKQNHRVCECMVVYRNCIKCNKKLAKRHSDYISLMVKHAKEASEHRQKLRPEEDHSFSEKRFHELILEKVCNSKMLCECESCIESGIRQSLSIRGRNKLSMDRVFDHLGYTHDNQILRLVSKSHHSWMKRNSNPCEVESQKRKWALTVKNGIIKRSKDRYKRTLCEIYEMEKAGMDTIQMKKWLETHIVDINNCYSMVLEKKAEFPQCGKCGIELDYGDENGITMDKNNPKRASVDRIDNRIGYVPHNVRMVCHSCQTMESIDDIEDVFLDLKETEELIKYIKTKIVSMRK